MWRRYNEDWERKKSYLTYSLFHDLPGLSPVREEGNGSSDTPPASPLAYRPYSPLPPLIIEIEPNRHDEPEHYYKILEAKIKRIYRKLFIESRELSDKDDLIDDSKEKDFEVNINNSEMKDDSDEDKEMTEFRYHISSDNYDKYQETTGYSADFESNISEGIPSEGTDQTVDETDENNKSKSRNDNNNDDEDNDFNAQNQMIDSNIDKALVGEADKSNKLSGKDFPEDANVVNICSVDKLGTDYRQITTQAEVHVDAQTVTGTRSDVYEDSVRSVILPSRQVQGRCRTERSDNDEDKATVVLEEIKDPDMSMTHLDSDESLTTADEIEVMRTPLHKLSMDSIRHALHYDSDVSERDVTLKGTEQFAMTSHSDISRAHTPDAVDIKYTCAESGSQILASDINIPRSVSDDVNVIFSVKDIIEIIGRYKASRVPTITSSTDVNIPIIGDVNEDHSMEGTENIVEGTEETGPSPDINVRVSNEYECRIINQDITIVEDNDATRLVMENVNVECSDKGIIGCESRDLIKREEVGSLTNKVIRPDSNVTIKVNGRKRKANEDVGIQTVSETVSWENLRGNLFVGAPKILRLCSCDDHMCY